MRAWIGKDGSTTVVLLVDEDTVMVHSNIGWLTFKKFDEGVTAEQTANGLVEGWDLEETDATPYEEQTEEPDPCQCTSCMPYAGDGY